MSASSKEPGKGTGLGLAVVYGIVAAHGGWIDCRSAVGAGTRFDVYLPAADGPAVGPPPPPSVTVGEAERVLIVDDEPLIRALAAEALTRVGFRAFEAEDGAMAVERVRTEGPFDLVVLDLTMPVMSGAEALQAIRQLVPEQKVLLASGYAVDQESITAVADGFLSKPYTATALAEAVRRLIKAVR